MARNLKPEGTSEVQLHLWSDDPTDPLARLTVEREWRRAGPLTIAQEQMSSTDHRRAAVVEVYDKMVLAPEEAEWLLVSIGRALGAEIGTEDQRDPERRLVPGTVVRFTRVLRGG